MARFTKQKFLTKLYHDMIEVHELDENKRQKKKKNNNNAKAKQQTILNFKMKCRECR